MGLFSLDSIQLLIGLVRGDVGGPIRSSLWRRVEVRPGDWHHGSVREIVSIALCSQACQNLDRQLLWLGVGWLSFIESLHFHYSSFFTIPFILTSPFIFHKEDHADGDQMLPKGNADFPSGCWGTISQRTGVLGLTRRGASGPPSVCSTSMAPFSVAPFGVCWRLRST